MSDRPKLTLKKPLSLQKQSQIFQALKPIHEQAEKEKQLQAKVKAQPEREAKQKRRDKENSSMAPSAIP